LHEDTLHHLPGKAVDYCKPKLRTIPAAILVICAVAIAGIGCSTASKPVVEATLPAPSSPTASADQSQPAKALPPAAPHEVQAAVKRVFKDSAIVDSSQKPAFVTGDFNGDSSQDLAVVLKPEASRVADMNEEFPSWILRDLSGAKESKAPRLQIGADEVLLAVIHGYGPNGWRDSQATQTFLLKNAAGSSMEAQSAKNFVAANKGRKMPGLRGDVVAEVLGGKSGYLYFTNSSYAWYDPKSFTGEAEPRRGHGAASSGMKH
jgi:hypothetical protein